MTTEACTLGNHKYDTAEVGTGYYYTDEANGVKPDTKACPACFLVHLQKYYPDSPVTIALTKKEEK